jgi:hypothetical protein
MNEQIATFPMPHPFEIRATAPRALAPDSLMVNWGDAPAGAVGQFYWPELDAHEVVDLARGQYGTHVLTPTDPHTVSCPVGGLTYIPVPSGSGSYAGLLTVTAPSATKRSDTFTVAVRQLSWAQSGAELTPSRTATPRRAKAASASVIRSRNYRRVIGAFQLTVTTPAQDSLLTEERTLALYRWLTQQMPTSKRWHPVFARFVEQIAERVTAYGGDPAAITPSPLGAVPWHEWPQPPGHGTPHHDEHFGKIKAVVFNHFGDFEGFLLEDTHGDEWEFRSRELRVLRLVREAEEHRTFCAVRSENDGLVRSIWLYSE